MSYYKEQLKNYLGKMEVGGRHALSIGSEHDDRKYFKSANFYEWSTLDNDQSLKPDIPWDMNRLIVDMDGDTDWFDLHEHFDFVFAFELWEYIFDPVTAHKNIYFFLNPGGTYMGSYPFIYPLHEPLQQDYLRYTERGIEKILIHCGFSSIKITRRVATKGRAALQEFVAEEGMRMSKKLTNYDWPIGFIVEAKK